jgi:hypothetical protein
VARVPKSTRVKAREVGYFTGTGTEHRGLSNEPKNIKIGSEMNEIWLKQCFGHISFVSGPILMFLGSLESHGVATGCTREVP